MTTTSKDGAAWGEYLLGNISDGQKHITLIRRNVWKGKSKGRSLLGRIYLLEVSSSSDRVEELTL